MLKNWELFRSSILAGICIAIGSTVYLSCSNKYIGTALFGIGLFLICTYGWSLFTGKIGYIVKNRKQYNLLYYIDIWLGNLVGCASIVLPLRIAKPDIALVAKELVESKLQAPPPQMIILGIMCGMMMFLAVNTYQIVDNTLDELISIFLPVSVFILCGFEHSIANMCYIIYAIEINPDQIINSIFYVIIISLSNAVGSILLCSLKG